MKLKKLNMRGFSHDIAMVLVVVIVAIVGVGYLVASHADAGNCSSGIGVTVVGSQCESAVGTYHGTYLTKPFTVTAYACVTKLSSTDWRTTGLFDLSNASAGGTATITNTGTTPLANNKSVSSKFSVASANATPSATVVINSNPNGQNPLSFTYGNTTSTGATTIASNIHPVNLTNCGVATAVVSAPVTAPSTYTPPPAGSSTLNENQRLNNGQVLESAGRKYELKESTGNLGIFPVGSSGGLAVTPGANNDPGSYAIMQPDGNFVQYNSSGGALWNSGTEGRGGTHVTMQDDGNLVMLNAGNYPLWSVYTGPIIPSAPAPTTLGVNQSLHANQDLMAANLKYQLLMQPDGNLVLYNLTGPIWNSGTEGSGATYVILQDDGNLVIYNAANQPVWQTKTEGYGGTHLVAQPDGNLVMYTAANQPVWQTGTEGR